MSLPFLSATENLDSDWLKRVGVGVFCRIFYQNIELGTAMLSLCRKIIIKGFSSKYGQVKSICKVFRYSDAIRYLLGKLLDVFHPYMLRRP